MDSKAIVKRIETLVSPVLENLGYEFVECEFVMGAGRWVLRLYIDREGGVTIDDCTKVSRGIEDLIDVEGLIPKAYTLEVSSPGINRPLRRKMDFEKFVGSMIKLKTLHPIGGRSNYKGYLTAVEGDDIVMSIDGSEYRVPLGELAKARIESEDLKPKGRAVN